MGGDDCSDCDDDNMDAGSGILLTVDFVSGLEVEAIPLLIWTKVIKP